MSLATKPDENRGTEAVAPRSVLLHGVPWELYQALRQLEENRHISMTYDQGELELMSPSRLHEQYKKLLSLIIYELAKATGLDLESDGSMTLKRQDLDRGLEPDECFYIQNARRMREIRELDLSADPPPDLVVEINYTHRALDREGIYAALGVPEVWRFDLDKLEFLNLSGGDYRSVETSAGFAGLQRSAVERFLKLRATQGEMEVLSAWRQWLSTEFLNR